MLYTATQHSGWHPNIIGTLQILPVLLPRLHYNRQIPKHCIIAKRIEVIAPSESSKLWTTVVITFQTKARDFNEKAYVLDKAFTFASFYPGSTEDTLNRGVDWLKDYVDRHSQLHNPPILSDFDEHYNHFDNPIEFPLTNLLNNDIDSDLLKKYANYLRIEINANELQVGDKIDARQSHNFANRGSSIVNQDSTSSRIINTQGGDYSEGNINTANNIRPLKSKASSPWLSGSFYLVVFIVVIAALSVVGKILPIFALPAVIIGGLIALSVIGALQLRHDERLGEKNFLELMALSFKYLPWIRSSNGTPSQNTSSTLSKTTQQDHPTE